MSEELSRQMQTIFQTLSSVDFKEHWLLSDLRVRKKGWITRALRFIGIAKIPYIEQRLYKLDLKASSLTLSSLIDHYVQNEGALHPEKYPSLETVLQVATQFNQLIDFVNLERKVKLPPEFKIDIAEIVVKSNIHEQVRNYQRHLAFLKEELPDYQDYPELREQIQEMVDWPLPAPPHPSQPRRLIENWVHGLKERIAANSSRLDTLKEEKYRQKTVAIERQLTDKIQECRHLYEQQNWDYAKDLMKKLHRRLSELQQLKNALPKEQYTSQFPLFHARYEELDEKCSIYLISIRSSLKERWQVLQNLEEGGQLLAERLLQMANSYRHQRILAPLRARLYSLLNLAEVPPPPDSLVPFKFEEWQAQIEKERKNSFELLPQMEREAKLIIAQELEKKELLKQTAKALALDLAEKKEEAHLPLETAALAARLEKQSLENQSLENQSLENQSIASDDWRFEALRHLSLENLEQSKQLAPQLIDLYQNYTDCSQWAHLVQQVKDHREKGGPFSHQLYPLINYQHLQTQLAAFLYGEFANPLLLFSEKIEAAKRHVAGFWHLAQERYEVIFKMALSSFLNAEESDRVLRPLFKKVQERFSRLFEQLEKQELQNSSYPLLAKEAVSLLNHNQPLDREDIEKIYLTLIEGEILVR